MNHRVQKPRCELKYNYSHAHIHGMIPFACVRWQLMFAYINYYALAINVLTLAHAIGMAAHAISMAAHAHSIVVQIQGHTYTSKSR